MKDEGKIWHGIIQKKYLRNVRVTSPFCKGVLWAARAVKFGYRWVYGNGKKVRFWEDTWFGTVPLAVRFWDLYTIANEKIKVIVDIVDGDEVKLTFSRTFSFDMMQRWHELVMIATSVVLQDDSDALVLQYEKAGVYSSKSFYAIINFRGATPVFVLAVWKIEIPPKIQMFLWLLSHNKLMMTLDHLLKRGIIKSKYCVFCSEEEPIGHLFFECVVAIWLWNQTASYLNIDIGCNFEKVATKWLDHKKMLWLMLFYQM